MNYHIVQKMFPIALFLITCISLNHTHNLYGMHARRDSESDHDIPGINKLSPRGLAPLHEAAENGNFQDAHDLLSLLADVNVKDDLSCTPLHHAARSACADTVSLLIENNAAIDASNIYGHTALHEAAKHKHGTDVIQALLEHKANPRLTDNNGLTPLHYAAQMGNAATVALLLGAKAKPFSPDKQGNTPLHLSASNGHLDATRLLLEAGTIVDSRDANNATALHAAAYNGRIPVIELLVRHKANLLAVDSQNKTPKKCAQDSQRPDAVKKLDELMKEALGRHD